MGNLWRELSPGPEPPEVIHVLVEIPKGSRNKYEFDKGSGAILLDRVLYSPFHFPGDYGLIPQTYYDDGDPLDVLVMVGEPSFPGCVIRARPVGLFRLMDRDKPDDKVLAVPTSDPLYRDVRELSDVPRHFLDEVAHFFQVYKDLEGVRVQPLGWESAERAREQIRHAVGLYRGQILVRG